MSLTVSPDMVRQAQHGEVDDAEFITPRAQILNQRPELVNC